MPTKKVTRTRRRNEPKDSAPSDSQPKNINSDNQQNNVEKPKRKKRPTLHAVPEESDHKVEAKECPNDNADLKAASAQDELSALNHREVERRILAIHAIRDAQIDHCIGQLQLARSMCSDAQLDMPFLQFLKEYCPNTIPTKRTENIIELEAKSLNANIPGSSVGEGQGSVGYPGSARARLSFSVDSQSNTSGFQFHSSAVNESFLRSIGLNLSSNMFEVNMEASHADGQSILQTPTMDQKYQSNIGITPKTSRLPKRGEILLSVHGSPLGVYCEDKMDTIKESQKEHQ